MSSHQVRSVYPPYSVLNPRFDHLDAWTGRLVNWGKGDAGAFRKLGYVLPCYAQSEDSEGGDELDADRVETLISEMRQAGGWSAHEAAVKAYFMGPGRTWEQVAQIIQRDHGRAYAEAKRLYALPADACRHLADRMCARLDVLDRAY